MKSWRSRQTCGSNTPPPGPPAPVAVEVFSVTSSDPHVIEVNLFYPDTGIAATIVAVSGPSTAADIDTDGGVEPGVPDPIVAPTSQLVFTTADPFTTGFAGGTWTITDLSGVTFDRPGGALLVPESGANP